MHLKRPVWTATRRRGRCPQRGRSAGHPAALSGCGEPHANVIEIRHQSSRGRAVHRPGLQEMFLDRFLYETTSTGIVASARVNPHSISSRTTAGQVSEVRPHLELGAHHPDPIFGRDDVHFGDGIPIRFRLRDPGEGSKKYAHRTHIRPAHDLDTVFADRGDQAVAPVDRHVIVRSADQIVPAWIHVYQPRPIRHPPRIGHPLRPNPPEVVPAWRQHPNTVVYSTENDERRHEFNQGATSVGSDTSSPAEPSARLTPRWRWTLRLNPGQL